MNLTHNLFDNVLHSDNSRRTAELINYNGNMNLVCLEVAQQIINHLGFRHKVSGANQRLPAEIVPFVQVRKQVLDVKHPLDIVTVVCIDGNTGINILHNTLHHILERGTNIQIHHIEAGGHDLLGGLSAKADDAFQNIILLRKFRLISQFQGM